MKKTHKIDKHTSARSSWAAAALTLGALAPIRGGARASGADLSRDPAGRRMAVLCIDLRLPSQVQTATGLAYAFRWGELSAMWRYLGYHSKSGKKLEDISFSGPLVGATFRW